MGLDFIRRCAPTFHRALDRRAIELNTPTLFSNDVRCVPRTAEAELCTGYVVVVGEKLLLRLLGERIVLQRANVVVAELSNPPIEFSNFVRAGCGIAGAEIKAVHSLSGVAEVSLCE
jgi:hypothetical protein